MSTYCRTHGRLYTEHVCDRPHDPTPSERRDLADSTEWPPVERVRATVASLNAQTACETAAAPKSLTERLSVYRMRVNWRERSWTWRWIARCTRCDVCTFHGSQPEAFAAAVAHVREHHTNPCDGVPVDFDELAKQLGVVGFVSGKASELFHDPDPAQAIWADIYNQPGGTRS